MNDEQYLPDDDFEEEASSETDLPNGWVWTTLSEICMKPEYGYTTSAILVKNGPKFLRITDIKDGKIDWANVPYCANPPLDVEKYKLKDGDILIARAGSIGKAYRISNPPFAVFASYLIRFQPIQVDSRFIESFLQSSKYWQQIREVSSGNVLLNVNAQKLSSLELPLPPLAEQPRIVAELEAQLSQLDNAVDNLKRQQAALPAYKASVLKSACEGSLVPQDPDDEPASQLLQRILDERRARWETEQLAKYEAAGKSPPDDSWKKKYPEPAQPDTTDLTALPNGWVWASVEQLGTLNLNEQIVLTGPFGADLGQKDFIKQGVPVLTIGCLTEYGLTDTKALYISESKANELSRYKVRVGDILFSRMASVGRADVVSKIFEGAIINYHLMRLRLNPSIIEAGFFISYIKGSSVVSNYLKKVNHGATRNGINTKQLLEMPIALPPLVEQRRISEETQQLLSTAQEQEKVIETSLKRAERLRQAILQKAFQGRLVPQDPNDEPAEKLLEKIIAEREEREKQRQAELATQKANAAPKEKKKMSTLQRRRPLLEVLLEANDKRLSPDELFRLAGFTVETIEEFYDELREQVLVRRLIKEDRQANGIYLKAVS